MLAKEAWPWVAGTSVVAVILLAAGELLWFGFAIALLVLLIWKFHDPDRQVPAAPLGIVSPVDGRVVQIKSVEDPYLDRAAVRINIAVNPFGAYMLRSPTEGKLHELPPNNHGHNGASHGLWVKTDEDDDIYVIVRGPTFAPPTATVRYGERIGQGQRSGYVRLAKLAEIYIPENSEPAVEVGSDVLAGASIIANLHR